MDVWVLDIKYTSGNGIVYESCTTKPNGFMKYNNLCMEQQKQTGIQLLKYQAGHLHSPRIQLKKEFRRSRLADVMVVMDIHKC